MKPDENPDERPDEVGNHLEPVGSKSKVSAPRRRWRIWAGIFLGLLAVFGFLQYALRPSPDAQSLAVLGQSELPAGGLAGVRIIVLNRHTGTPVEGARVRVWMERVTGKSTATATAWQHPLPGDDALIADLKTGPEGTPIGEVHLPELTPGAYDLVVEARSDLGHDELRRRVRVTDPRHVLLTLDKPLYQPGQTVHLRALVLHGADRTPLAERAVTFLVEDSKGNKVFRASRVTSRFGIASADFDLAHEPNLGRYRASVLLGDATADRKSPASAERSFEVKRYVLPKFKIAVEPDRSWYLPGDTVRGRITARYFFGQPVAQAPVRLRLTTRQEGRVELASTEGVTDEEGRWDFALPLPEVLTGTPLQGGHAALDIVAEVTDTAGQTETTTLPSLVARQPLEVTVFPEMGTWAPGLTNRFYVVTTHPDGRPAPCQLRFGRTQGVTGENGIAELAWKPEGDDDNHPLEVEDAAGHVVSQVLSVTNAPTARLLLRTDRPVYAGGDTIRGTILARGNGPAFLDAVHEGRTVLTRSLRLRSGRAAFALSVPPNFEGFLELHAYRLAEGELSEGVSQLVAVKPAADLRIQTRVDAPEHRPGETARLDITVTHRDGRPAPAALGVSVVDEALFALRENQPGLLGELLAAQAELLAPRAQVKFAVPPWDLFTGATDATTARVWLAAALQGHFAARPRKLEGLIKALGMPRGWIEQHILSCRNAPSYERLRQDPQYGPILAMLEQGSAPWSLRGDTRIIKADRDKAFRKQRTNTVAWLAFGITLLAPLLITLGKVLGEARDLAGTVDAGSATDREGTGTALQFAYRAQSILSLLVLLPYLAYPVGVLFYPLLTGDDDARTGPMLVLLLEGLIVVAVVFWLRNRARTLQSRVAGPFPPGLFALLDGFLFQFVLIRAGWVLALTVWPQLAEALGGWGVLGSVLAPVLLLATGEFTIARFRSQHEIPDRRPQTNSGWLALALFVFLFLLGGMMLPALSKAKAKAQRVTLINNLKQVEIARQIAEIDAAEPNKQEPNATPRVRRDFPETLFWQPELITDDAGRASLELPLADSITTWRASFDAVSGQGTLGATNLPLRVFQPFFVDLDLPLEMTLHDEVEVPLVCYNYLDRPQTVRLHVASGDWFTSSRAGQDLTLNLGPNEVKSIGFPLKLTRVGQHRFRVEAWGEDAASASAPPVTDAIERLLTVRPSGFHVERTQNFLVRDRTRAEFELPANIVPGSGRLRLKLYPTRVSEVLEGIEGLFQAPYGCFEQTSSVTYPNVLALTYLSDMDRLTPEIELRARIFINEGYQRLLGFEVPGGGFDWFGHPPANACLTAYGVLEFTDMSRVRDVDPEVLQRALAWLTEHQSPDGSWREGRIGWTWQGRGTLTAFVAWALAEAGVKAPCLDRALQLLHSQVNQFADNYTRALVANAFLARDRNDADGRRLLVALLKDVQHAGDDGVHWQSSGCGVTYSRGASLDLETTALVATALMKSGESLGLAREAVTWLSLHKAGRGGWATTQATILAMRALLADARLGGRGAGVSDLVVRVNGQPVHRWHRDDTTSDLLLQTDLSPHLRLGHNVIELTQDPAGRLTAQLEGEFWLPTAEPGSPANPAPTAETREPGAATPLLRITQEYDRTRLAVSESLWCTVEIRVRGNQPVPMALVDLGIPPGFDTEPADFTDLVARGLIAKWERKGTRVCLYTRLLQPETPLRFRYRLRARMPLRVTTRPAIAYEYYAPDNRAAGRTRTLEVTASAKATSHR